MNSSPVILVTGSARRVGAAIARALHGAGARIVLHYRSAAGAAEALATELNTTRPASATCVHGDLGHSGEPERIAADALAAFGRIDVLVNNAGIRDNKDFGTFTRAEFDRIVSVNLTAAFFTSQAVLPAMRQQGGGRIIHIASQMGHVAADKRAVDMRDGEDLRCI